VEQNDVIEKKTVFQSEKPPFFTPRERNFSKSEQNIE